MRLAPKHSWNEVEPQLLSSPTPERPLQGYNVGPSAQTLKFDLATIFTAWAKGAKYLFFGLKESRLTNIFCFYIAFSPPGRNPARRRAAGGAARRRVG